MVGLGKQAIGMYSHFEKIENSLSGMMGSAQKGAEMFEELRQFSFDTTFGVDELADATTQLVQAGVDADEVKNKLTQIGNIAGGDKQKFKELIEIYAKMSSTGKVTVGRLSELALRGVPIYKTLDKIGASGKKSIEDINKAFEDMTSEGGMFFNAMDSINNTIEGKEGFVSDTWKEVLVNMAKATGLADGYKVALTKILEVIDGLNNKIKAIADNPVASAILRGVILTTLSALVLVIGTSLVLALKAVATQLGIIAALKTAITGGVGLAVAGIVAGIGVIGTVIGANIAKHKAEQAEIEKTNELLGIQINSFSELGDSQAISAMTDKISELNTALESSKDKLKEAESKMNVGNLVSGSGLATDIGRYAKQQSEQAKKEYDYQKKIVDSLQSKINDMEHILDLQKQINDSQSEYEQSRANLESILTEGESENVQQLQAYQEQLAKITEQYNQTLKTKVDIAKQYLTQDDIDSGNTFYVKEELLINADPEFKQMLDDATVKLKKNIEEAKLKVDIEKAEVNSSDYQKFIAELFGLSMEQAVEKYGVKKDGSLNVGTATIVQQLKDLLESPEKQFDKYSQANGGILSFLSPDKIGFMEEVLNQAEKTFKGLIEYTDVVTDKTTTKYADKGNLNVNADKIQELVNVLTAYREKLNTTKKEEYQKNGYSDFLSNGLSEEQANKLKETLGEDYDMISYYESEITRTVEEIHHAIVDVGLEPTDEAVKKLTDHLSELKTKLPEEETEEIIKNLSTTIADLKNSSKTKYSNGDYWGGMGDQFGAGVLELTEGNDLGNMINGLIETGDPLQSLLKVVVDDIVDIIGSCENLNVILNPIKIVLERLRPSIQEIVNMIATVFAVVENIIAPIIEILNDMLLPVLKLLTILLKIILIPIQILANFLQGLASRFSSAIDDFSESLKEGTSWLDEFYSSVEENTTVTDSLIQKYKSLMDAIQDNIDYYEEHKATVSAQAQLQTTKVNDMILTPQGNFSTDPNDYIIASKNPSALGVNGVNMSVQINNSNAGNNDVKVSQGLDSNGMATLLIDISKKVADDVARGANGWDNALSTQQNRIKGRKVTI